MCRKDGQAAPFAKHEILCAIYHVDRFPCPFLEDPEHTKEEHRRTAPKGVEYNILRVKHDTAHRAKIANVAIGVLNGVSA